MLRGCRECFRSASDPSCALRSGRTTKIATGDYSSSSLGERVGWRALTECSGAGLL